MWDFHHLRTRKIGSEIAVDVHVKMDGSLSLTEAHDIASRVERSLHDRFGSASVITIHMEPYLPQVHQILNERHLTQLRGEGPKSVLNPQHRLRCRVAVTGGVRGELCG